jgi:hypothetical protein
MEIENSSVLLQVNLSGGSFSDFHFKDLPVNPVNFQSDESEIPFFRGHFLCFDRWGPPTAAEKANGFNHHGEVNTQLWKLLNGPESLNGLVTSSMMCSLPMGGLQLTRTIELSETEPVFLVTEEIMNLNKYGRMFNIVQHVSIAPPFLDRSTIFDTNAGKGYENREDGTCDQEEPVMTWPYAWQNGETMDLRQFHSAWPRVASFVYNRDERIGWVTASNPACGLMLGYFWEINDYPWINFWRSMEKGLPVAFGMEFGTTGMHEPFPVLAKKGKIFGCNIYDFIDAGEVIPKKFTAFLAKIPGDYKGVSNIEFSGSAFTIKERSQSSRDISYSLIPGK